MDYYSIGNIFKAQLDCCKLYLIVSFVQTLSLILSTAYLYACSNLFNKKSS